MEDLKDKEEEELKRTFTEGGAIAAYDLFCGGNNRNKTARSVWCIIVKSDIMVTHTPSALEKRLKDGNDKNSN